MQTPSIVLDVDVLERNVTRMAARAAALGVTLRPHVKTHKCAEIGKLQLERGARGITVATFAEARDFVTAGFTDVTLAFPLDPGKADLAIDLAREIPLFRSTVDDRGAAEALAAAARRAGIRAHVFLKVDCGYHRAGVNPSSPASLGLARFLSDSPSLAFDGLLSHSGHAYAQSSPEGIRRVAEEERAVMVEFAGTLRAAGIEVREVSVGSTPSMTHVARLDGVTEARPGNYAFYDAMQVALSCARVEDVAVTIAASVVSHQTGASHFVVDAGALALSKDQGPAHVARELGHGPLLAPDGGLEEGLRVESLSQEHGIVRAATPGRIEGRFPVGERVRIMPVHSCLAVAHFDEYVLVKNGAEAGRWKIGRGR